MSVDAAESTLLFAAILKVRLLPDGLASQQTDHQLSFLWVCCVHSPRMGVEPKRLLLAVAALTASAVCAAPPAAADVNSYYDALHALGITSPNGDQALFAAGTAMCKDTAFYLRYGGDWSFFGARRKAAEDLVLNNLQRARGDVIIVANTAIDHLCPQYNYTWVAE